MALVMVQGHVFDHLLSPLARAEPLYQLEVILHGSTAPGFLFASGFVAGLPRSPLSVKASLRRARRLLFVLGVGYALHLPYFSFWKTLTAPPAEKAALFACDALQLIAVTQLFVLAVQWLAGQRWTVVTGSLAILAVAAGPLVWTSRLSASLHPALAAYVDASSGSPFPVFPFSLFVLAGTVAGAELGREDALVRKSRSVAWGAGLIAAGLALYFPFESVVDFWGVSPSYALLRLGGLLILLQLVERAARNEWTGIGTLALLGHETLLVYVFHLYLLFGSVVVPAPPLGWLAGSLGFLGCFAVVLLMVPVLLCAAWLWHRTKQEVPQRAGLLLTVATTALLFEFLARPW